MTFFYDLNKKLQQVLEMPKSEHKQLNEGAVAEAGYSAKDARAGKDIGKPGKQFAKIAKGAAERYGSKERGEKVAGAVLNKLRHPKEGMEEGLGDVVRKGVAVAKKVGSKALDTLGHGSDEELRKDLQRKMGLPATGEKPTTIAFHKSNTVDDNAVTAKPRTPLAKESAPMTPKQKKFAKLAPPADKITFADKIAGAKKEVDEMLGDVAAEAMKSAVGATRKIAGKRYGGAAQTDDEPQVKPAVPRGRGRPKKPTNTEQGAELKPDWSAFGVKKVKLAPHKGNVTKHKLSDKEPGEQTNEADDSQLKAAIKMLKKAGYRVEKAEELDEKAVSKKQQKFMGMVHAAQKGEKPASKEVAKVAKEMPKKAAKDFASTKHKGLPEKAPKKEDGADKSAEKPKKKKEKTEEAGGSGTPTASSGFSFGKGIYDSINRELESMIAEGMNVSMNMNNDGAGGPSKSLTVTATDEDAAKLAELLKMAGLGGGEQMGGEEHGDCGCGTSPCSCNDAEVVDENSPDWPTNTETSKDAMQYSGGLNKPKATGQTTTPVIASQEERQHSYADVEEDAIHRMMEMAGIKKKAVEEEKTDEGNKFTGNLAKARAAGKKEADLDGDGDMEKVQESIFALTNQWKAYKG